jgi:LysM repeat protein
MTRETKIGLLVGLAFIIVIGILLSDHLTNSNEPPQATLIGAGNGVRQAVGNPGSGGAGAPVTVVTPVVTPQQQVATQRELTPPPVIVKIGPATPVAPAPTVEQPVVITPKPAEPAAVAQDNSQNTPAPVKPAAPTNDELSRIAEQHGEPLVGLNDSSKPAQTTAGGEYVVQPGDSLSKIAAKLMGSSSKANIDAIVKANPSLKGDPNKIVAGRSYQIPSPAAAKAAAAAPAVAPAVAVHDADDAITQPVNTTDTHVSKPAAPAVAAAQYLYTVQPGDNLTKIARDQVGDIRAVAAIQELNGDTLKGAKKDVVISGTKLRLPGKPIAKAD